VYGWMQDAWNRFMGAEVAALLASVICNKVSTVAFLR
jgi:hypothetical protein